MAQERIKTEIIIKKILLVRSLIKNDRVKMNIEIKKDTNHD
jgi:hypothetical protein